MNKIGLLASSLLIAATVAASTSASAAYSFLVTATGQKSGKFKGPGEGGKIPAVAFSYSVRSPRDAASGLATGKRQHSPVTFTKPWDATSPIFFNAIATNENLTSVLFEFSQPDIKGTSTVYQTVKLTNASVSGVTRRTAAAAAGATDLEDITLTFQKIEITHVAGGITASDDWEASAL